MIRIFLRLLRFVVCRHYWVAASTIPGDHGVIMRRRCIRCQAVDHIYASGGRAHGAE